MKRLNIIRQQMDGLKDSKMAMGGDSIIQMSGFAPPMLLALGTRLASRLPQFTVNTVTTNVPGPQIPLYVLGRQMVEAYPFVPIMGSVRISIAIFSYLGGLNFGVTGDYDGAPDIEVLCRGIEDAVGELREISHGAMTPEPADRPRRSAAPRTRARRPRRPRVTTPH